MHCRYPVCAHQLEMERCLCCCTLTNTHSGHSTARGGDVRVLCFFLVLMRKLKNNTEVNSLLCAI